MYNLNIQVNPSIWRFHKYGIFSVYLVGDIDFGDLCTRLGSNVVDLKLIESFLYQQKGSFGLIIQSDKECIAATDRIRSYPIYYDESTVYDASTIPQVTSPDEQATLAYLLSGYVTGSNTLDNAIKQVQAGEYIHKKVGGTINAFRYFIYYPNHTDINRKEADYHDELSAITENIFKKLVDRLDGRKVLLPLSGGLDSRLILSKLVELGYDNIYVFTYGVKNSNEFQMAKHVCDVLNIKWNYIGFSEIKSTSNTFDEYMCNYLSQCGLISSMFSLMEVAAFYELQKNKIITPDTVVLNGQTGDFISGAHIRMDQLKTVSKERVFDYIIKKHFSLWPMLLTPNNKSIILSHLEKDLMELSTYIDEEIDFLHFYEYWEYKERQAKFVVNGQRLYDSLNCRWELPFWNADLIEFWKSCPLQFKFDQNLYVTYLQKYNYKNIFDVLRIPADPWLKKHSWVKYIAGFLGLITNKTVKNTYYKYMDYHSTYADQYHILGRDLYKKHWKDIRNPASLGGLYSLNHLGIDANNIFERAKECV